MVKCDICGAVSDLDEVYIVVRKSFRLKTITYCPECQIDKQLSSHKGFFWLVGALLLVSIIVGFFDAKKGWSLFGFFIFLVFLEALIIPHELGHAVVARCLGLHVFKIIIGSGKVLVKFNFLSFRWEINQFPLHGLTLSFPKSANFFRLKRFLVILAGPAVNMALLILAYQAYRYHHYFEAWSISLWPLTYFIAANVYLAAVNLFPHSFKTAYGKIRSDGLALLTAPFLKKEEIHESIALYFALEGLELRKKDQNSDAIMLFKEGLSAYPDNWTLLNCLGTALLDTGKFDNARAIFSTLIDKAESNTLRNAWASNNLAFTYILMGKKELLEKADTLSAIAFGTCPWEFAIKGTRGSVLVELGQLDEGIALLKDSFQKTDYAKGRANNAAYLALAELRKGNTHKAEEYLEIAVAFDPECLLLQRVTDEICN